MSKRKHDMMVFNWNSSDAEHFAQYNHWSSLYDRCEQAMQLGDWDAVARVLSSAGDNALEDVRVCGIVRNALSAKAHHVLKYFAMHIPVVVLSQSTAACEVLWLVESGDLDVNLTIWNMIKMDGLANLNPEDFAMWRELGAKLDLCALKAQVAYELRLCPEEHERIKAMAAALVNNGIVS
jgi:hypothetical protein